MVKFYFICVSLLLCSQVLAQSSKAIVWGDFLPSKDDGNKIVMLSWNSPEGQKRLQHSKFKNDFFQAAHAFQPMINGVYASVASAVIVLNALRLPKGAVPSQSELEIQKPRSLGGGTVLFPAYSQETFLNEDTDKIKDRQLIMLKNRSKENEDDKSQFSPGLGLAHLKEILEKVYKAKAEVTYVDSYSEKGVAHFREELKAVVTDASRFIISNFKGDVFGANNEGTMSPLVAYDQGTDSILVLDTGGHKNPWYWVPLKSLYRAMNVPYSGNNRGFILVSD